MTSALAIPQVGVIRALMWVGVDMSRNLRSRGRPECEPPQHGYLVTIVKQLQQDVRHSNTPGVPDQGPPIVLAAAAT